jgi:hypothetical protein
VAGGKPLFALFYHSYRRCNLVRSSLDETVNFCTNSIIVLVLFSQCRATWFSMKMPEARSCMYGTLHNKCRPMQLKLSTEML